MARPRKDGTTMADDPPPMYGPITMYAEMALKRGPAGIDVHFKNADYLNPDACRKALIQFRNAFSSLKAKDRREAQRTGRFEAHYEHLGCYVDQTEEGWIATVRKNNLFPSLVTEGGEVEVAKEFRAEYQRWKALQYRTTEVRRGEPCPWSADDVNFFWEFDPEMARHVFEDMGWELPTKGTEHD